MRKLFILGLFILLFSSFASASLTDADAWYDVSGQWGNMTTNGTPIGINGKINGSIDFDGSTDYIDSNYDPDTIYTLSAWVYFETYSTRGNVFGVRDSTGSAGTREFYLAHSASNTLLAQYYTSSNGDAGSVTATITENAWNHVVLTRNGDNIEVFIDNVSQGTDSTASKNNPSRDIVIGRLGEQAIQYFTGNIDEIAFYGDVLTSQEISDLYNSGTGEKATQVTTSDLELYSSMDGLWDWSGNSGVGNASGGVGFGNYSNYGAYEFDGTDDIIEIGTGVFSNRAQVSVSSWIYRGTDTDGGIINEFGSASVFPFQLVSWDPSLHGGIDLRFSIINSTDDAAHLDYLNALNTGQWYHIVATYDGSTMRLFVDGTLYGTTQSQTGNTQTSSLNAYIGHQERQNYFFDGNIANTGIYYRNLTQSEVTELYNSGTPLNPYASTTSPPPPPTNLTLRTGFDEYYINTPLARYFLNDSIATDSNVLESWNNYYNGTASGWEFDNITNVLGTNEAHTQSSMTKYGNYYNFTTASSYIQHNGFAINNPDDISFAGNFSYSLWVNTFNWNLGDASEDSYFLIRNQGHYLRITDLGNIEFRGDDTGTIPSTTLTSSTGVIEENTWQHIVVTNSVGPSENRTIVYVDGVVAINGTMPAVSLQYTQSFRKRFADIDQPAFKEIQSALDEIKVINKTLTPSEVLDEMTYVGAMDSDVIAYYDFDNDDGNTVVDRNNKGQHVQFPSASNQVVPYNDSSLIFDGVDDVIELGETSFGSSSDDFASTGWFKISEDPVQDLEILGGGALNKIYYRNSSQTLRVIYVDSNLDGYSLESSTGLDDNVWHHFVFNYEKDSPAKLYVDGLEVDSNPATSYSLSPSTEQWYIGTSTNSSTTRFEGSLSNVRIYNQSLSSEEVSTLYYGLINATFEARDIVTDSLVPIMNMTSSFGNLTNVAGTGSVPVAYGLYNFNFTNGNGYTDTSEDFTIALGTTTYTSYAYDSPTGFTLNEYVHNTTGFNLTITRDNYSKEVFANNETIYMNLSSGDYNATISLNGTDKVIIPFTLVAGSNTVNLSSYGLNYIYFYDEATTLALDNSNISVTYPSGTSLDLITDSEGRVFFDTADNLNIQEGNYTITIGSKQGYLTPITFTKYANQSTLPFNVSYNISVVNININIYYRGNGTYFQENATIIAQTLFNATVENGSYSVQNITISAGTYVFQVASDGYYTEQKTVEYTSQEDLNLDFYLLQKNQSNTKTLTIRVLNDFQRYISNATVSLQEYDEDSLSYVTISECISNAEGECEFLVELSTKSYIWSAVKVEGSQTFTAQSEGPEIFQPEIDGGGEVVTSELLRTLILEITSSYTLDILYNLRYNVSDSFNNVTNVSTISVYFYTTDGTSVTMCVEYFDISLGTKDSLTNTTYCVTGSSGSILPSTGFNLNRSKNYVAEVHVTYNGNKKVLEQIYLNADDSLEQLLKDTVLLEPIYLFIWIGLLSLSLMMGNLQFFGVFGIAMSWVEAYLFPSLFITEGAVLKTVILVFLIYASRKREDLA